MDATTRSMGGGSAIAVRGRRRQRDIGASWLCTGTAGLRVAALSAPPVVARAPASSAPSPLARAGSAPKPRAFCIRAAEVLALAA
eukprot:8468392-Lingulodinium_polyedra.AAC.1